MSTDPKQGRQPTQGHGKTRASMVLNSLPLVNETYCRNNLSYRGIRYEIIPWWRVSDADRKTLQDMEGGGNYRRC